MCFHITATLPKGTNLEPIRQIIDEYDMDFTPLTNEFVASQLRHGALYFVATKGHCDCDTVLGYLSTSQIHQSIFQSKKYKTLIKKGWSEEKLDEWVVAKFKKLQEKRGKHGRKLSPVEETQRATRWINFISALLNTGSISHVGLLKHWYSNRIDSEQFSIKKTQRVNLNEANVAFLTHLDEDILYEFFTPTNKY
ncbi:MAG: hypothetical protein HWN66_11855 [Candidatus Helarchaeota archaeon]|nr:hypothetical protein [Candidatus Helarchaeota archaeon]